MKNTIEIKDLSLAAYLYSLGDIQLVGKRKSHEGNVYFQFSPKQKAEELISLYWRLQAPPTQPKKLFSALRDLKDMLFGT